MYTDTTTPRSDYPRPDRDRSQHWISLNGPWSFQADYGSSSTPEGLRKAVNEQVPSLICVPFAWETKQSGVNRTWLEHGVYSRQVDIPKEWLGRRTVLCFGAVFYRAEVYVNDMRIGVGTHLLNSTSQMRYRQVQGTHRDSILTSPQQLLFPWMLP